MKRILKRYIKISKAKAHKQEDEVEDVEEDYNPEHGFIKECEEEDIANGFGKRLSAIEVLSP